MHVHMTFSRTLSRHFLPQLQCALSQSARRPQNMMHLDSQTRERRLWAAIGCLAALQFFCLVASWTHSAPIAAPLGSTLVPDGASIGRRLMGVSTPPA